MHERTNEATGDPWDLVENGAYGEARELYTALYANQGGRFYLHNRGICALLQGDYAAALADFTQATVESGTRYHNDSDSISQGICFWYLGQPTRTVECLKHSLAAAYTDAAGGVEAPALLLYVAERLDNSTLRQEALRLLRRHARRKLTVWPGPIVPFLLGKIDVLRFEQEARTVPALQARWQCQADFFIGLRALQAGDNQLFAEYMTRCVVHPEGLLEHEYYFARWEIALQFPERAFST